MKKIISLLLFLLSLSLACSLTGERKETLSMKTEPTKTSTIAPVPTITPDKSEVCKVVAKNLNLRAGSSVFSAVIDYLNTGDILKVLPSPVGGVWLKVKTETGKTGFVNSNFIKCQENKK